jgi:hypothetical protein
MSEEEPKKEPLSRRDFLRRAGKEAVDTGAQLVPGGQVIQSVIGSDEKPSLWARVAKWRKSKETDNNS